MSQDITIRPSDIEEGAADFCAAPAGTAMRRIRATILGLCGAAALLGGCATDNETGPFFLGAVDAAEMDEATPADGIAPAVKRVRSNKLLGAMALEKVTGRTIDPSRLSEPD